jgi:hypothetical protein
MCSFGVSLNLLRTVWVKSASYCRVDLPVDETTGFVKSKELGTILSLASLGVTVLSFLAEVIPEVLGVALGRDD